MSRKQVSKRNLPPHKTRSRFNPERLTVAMRREWRKSHGSESSLKDHVERALEVELPVDVEEGSLVAQVRDGYLNTRAEMTEERVRELGARSAAAATDRLTFEQFVPSPQEASADQLIDVSRGISIAKIALNRTMVR